MTTESVLVQSCQILQAMVSIWRNVSSDLSPAAMLQCRAGWTLRLKSTWTHIWGPLTRSMITKWWRIDDVPETVMTMRTCFRSTASSSPSDSPGRTPASPTPTMTVRQTLNKSFPSSGRKQRKILNHPFAEAPIKCSRVSMQIYFWGTVLVSKHNYVCQRVKTITAELARLARPVCVWNVQKWFTTATIIVSW